MTGSFGIDYSMEIERAPQQKLRDKDFAERSGERSGVISLQTLVLLGNDR